MPRKWPGLIYDEAGEPVAKRCTHCFEVLPLTGFRRRKKPPQRYDSWCRTCVVTESREFRRANPLTRDQYREKALRSRYGITGEQYLAMMANQGGRCLLCRALPAPDANRWAQLHVDHCHRTGDVRALLCQNCNRGLGMFQEDPVVLRRAANWLEGRLPL